MVIDYFVGIPARKLKTNQLFMFKKNLFGLLALILMLSTTALASPDEFSGVVTRVIDGDTIEVQDFGKVRLADIDAPEMGTSEGRSAEQYTTAWLQSNIVHLDVDDRSKTDRYGRFVCVVYLSKPDGSVNTSRNFNKMLVDSGHACVTDFTNNEFNPAEWWGGKVPSSALCASRPLQHVEESETPSTAVSTSTTGLFVGSIKSNKYHYPNCEGAKKIKPSNEIWFSSSEDARFHRYEPCKICNPP
jgi:micrococcal nuclease